MKFATFHRDSALHLGAVQGDIIVDLTAADADVPQSMADLLVGGADAVAAARAAASSGKSALALDKVALAAPIGSPAKFLGIGLNYRSHLDELKRHGGLVPPGTNQLWFNKQVSSINGPYDPIHLPDVSDQLDYEGELAVVIGRRCRHVARADAHRVVFGYMVVNDVSVRDWQARSPGGLLGKSFDTHGPCGPWITTADEVPEPEQLALRTWVDGELRQDGNTSEMVAKLADMICYLTTVFTLEPGDILCTGTPAGVGQGFDPPRFLKAGQRVRVEIEGLGAIVNEVVPEPPETRFIA